MTFKVAETKIKTIRPGDRLWYINTGLTLTARAGFEISDRCPGEFKAVVAECINKGWLKPVSYMRDDEYMWEELKE